MAFFTEIRNSDVGLYGRMSYVVEKLSQTLEQRKRARQTYAELAGLTDRELSDLGMGRGDIRRVAREAARGKL